MLEGVREVVRRPYCGFEGGFNVLNRWRFRFYDVEMFICPRCGGKFNHYSGMSPRDRRSEYVVRIKPRVRS